MPSELPGRIVIRGLRCAGRQGPTAADRQELHEYLVDVALSLDLSEAAARDDLGSALDIAEIAAAVRDEIARAPRVLLERMSADVGEAILRRFGRVTEVQVSVEKPEPDGLGARSEAVELTISR